LGEKDERIEEATASEYAVAGSQTHAEESPERDARGCGTTLELRTRVPAPLTADSQPVEVRTGRYVTV